MNKLKYIAAVLIAIAGFGLQQANAATVPFTSLLNAGNSAVSGFTGPYGTVTINLVNSTTATVTFTSNTVAGNIYLFGAAQAIDLNVNATTFTVGAVTGTNAGTGFTPGPLTAGGSQNVDGLGTFNLSIDSFDGFTHSSDTVTFTVTNTSLTPWATANDVIINNAAGFDAAAHIFVTTSPANASNSALATGFAGEGPQGNVPDGGTTVMLLGAALGALGMARRFIMS